MWVKIFHRVWEAIYHTHPEEEEEEKKYICVRGHQVNNPLEQRNESEPVSQHRCCPQGCVCVCVCVCATYWALSTSQSVCVCVCVWTKPDLKHTWVCLMFCVAHYERPETIDWNTFPFGRNTQRSVRRGVGQEQHQLTTSLGKHEQRDTEEGGSLAGTITVLFLSTL